MKKLKTWQIVLLVIFYPAGIIYLGVWLYKRYSNRSSFSSSPQSLTYPSTVSQVPNGAYTTRQNVPCKEESFFVVGVQYYLDNIKKLATSNPDYKSQARTIINAGKAMQKIFKYSYVNKPVKLIPEPKNAHDKNAVKVLIAGELVGYLSREDNVHVKNILSSHNVIFISSFISGGAYKLVSEDGSIKHLEQNIHINVRIGYN